MARKFRGLSEKELNWLGLDKAHPYFEDLRERLNRELKTVYNTFKAPRRENAIKFAAVRLMNNAHALVWDRRAKTVAGHRVVTQNYKYFFEPPKVADSLRKITDKELGRRLDELAAKGITIYQPEAIRALMSWERGRLQYFQHMRGAFITAQVGSDPNLDIQAWNDAMRRKDRTLQYPRRVLSPYEHEYFRIWKHFLEATRQWENVGLLTGRKTSYRDLTS